ATEELREKLGRAQRALNEALQFIARLPPLEQDAALHRQRVAQLHAIDHLMRLCTRLQTAPDVAPNRAAPEIAEAGDRMERLLKLVHQGLDDPASFEWLGALRQQRKDLSATADAVRARLLESNQIEGGLAHALELTDILRFIERSATHLQRVCRYLLAGRQAPVE